MTRIKTGLVAIGVMPAGPLSVIYLHLLQTHIHMCPLGYYYRNFDCIFLSLMIWFPAKQNTIIHSLIFFPFNTFFRTCAHLSQRKTIKRSISFQYVRSLFVRHAGVPLSSIFLMDSIFGC